MEDEKSRGELVHGQLGNFFFRLRARLKGRQVVRVKGLSMFPSLAPGDELEVAPLQGGVERGELVVLRHPYVQGKLLVKRVERVEKGRVHLAGDNKKESSDSRVWGGLPSSSLVGRVVRARRRGREVSSKFWKTPPR